MKFKQFILYPAILSIILSGIGLAAEKAGTATLTIHITGFENSKGVARVALINSKENYSQNTPYKGFNTGIIDKEAIQTIPGLPRGEYAVKVYHDENENDELDTRIFGIPAESYGFSNNARGTLGPPEYEKAAFLLDSPEQEISIQIK